MKTLPDPNPSPRAGARSPVLSLARQLAPLLILALLPATAGATTYYFSTSGNDANAGTDAAAPKQSLAAAADLALPGNTLLLKRGDTWYRPAANPAPLDLRNKAGTADAFIRFDAYGEGAKPVIASLARLDDAGWSNVPGTNTWQQTVSGYSDAWRLYVDGVSKYRVNASNAAANETAVDQPHEWYIKPVAAGASAIVYVNTGSATTAPHNVEVHPVTASSVVLMKNTHYLSLRNLDFRGGSQYNVIYIEAASSHLVLDENIIQRANASGLLVTNLESGVDEYVSDITITNNLVDKVWSAQENDPAVTLSGDGIFILHAVDGGLIKGNTVRNWGHVAITLSSYRAGFHGVHNMVVEQNTVYSDASGYMHGLDVDGFEGLTSYNIIRRNLFHDYQATIHAQGDHNQYYSNIFTGVTLTSQPLHSQQPWGMDLIPWKYTDGNWMAAHDNYIVNNTIVGTQQYPIVMSDDPASTSVVGNNVIANNIIYSYGPSSSGEIGLNITPAVRGEIPVRNNAFWDFSATAAVARYKSSSNSTAAQLNSQFPATCSGNVQVDPGFANVNLRDFRLTAASPDAVKSGGLDLSATLGAGFVDFNGDPWQPGTPSIGALQFSAAGQPANLNANIAPGIIAGPVNQTALAGDSASFSVIANGNTPLSYQWRKAGTPIAGATAATYTIASTAATDAGSYDVVLTNPVGSTTSSAATLTVNPIPPDQEQNLSKGKTVTYSAIRSGESTGVPVSYLTDGDTSLTHLVAVGNASQLVSVTVNLPQASTITRLKMWHYWGDGRTYHDVIVQLSSTANFSSGVTTVFNNDTNNSAGLGVGTDAEYAETSAGKEIVLPAPVIAQYARFYIAANSVNTFNHYVELQVFGYLGINTAPAIATGPSSQAATVGDGVTFSVAATGAPAPSYQWRKGGAPIAGATDASYVLPSVLVADAGSYDVVVKNMLGTVTSPPAVLTVNPAAAAVTLGDLIQTYDGTPRVVAVTTIPAGLPYAITYDGAPAPPVNAGLHAITVTVTDANYTGSANDTLVVGVAPAGVTLGSLAQTYDGSPKPVTVATNPAGLPVTLTYNGSAGIPTNAGSYAVSASVSDPNYAGGSSGTLVIAPAAASLSLSGLLQSYDGSARVVTPTVTPASLPVAVTYDDSATAPVLPGVYAVVATVTDPNYHAIASDSLVVTVTALVRRAPSLNGGLDGSLQLAEPGNVTLGGNAWISGDLLTPGTPTVRLNGAALYGSTLNAGGAADPASYVVTLNGNTALRHVMRRVDATPFPVIPAPPAPAGTRNVSINAAGQSPGDFATLRNLTLNGNAGDLAVPPGTYGAFTVNGSSRLILGITGAVESSVYNLQSLTLNGASRLVLSGPVVLKLAQGTGVSGSINESGSPDWLELEVAAGGVTLNGGVVLNGYVVAPDGTVTINGGTVLSGGIIADQLVINGSGRLQQPAD